MLRFDPSSYNFENIGPLDVHTADADPYDPFATNAVLALYATGIRNAYDLVWHSNGELYVPTNANGGQGQVPDQPAPSAGVLSPRIDEVVNGSFTSPQQVNGFSTEASNDFLFKVEEGGYYGHANPTRNEYIQDGGNPTAGVDPQEFDLYPVGTLPDRNYRGAAFDFGARISPNGVIEYQYDGFDGALQGRLIVARYSAGDDLIVLDPSGSNGDIVSSNSAIASFDDFIDPLDLVESPTGGFLYVTSLTQGSTGTTGSLKLLRPLEAAPVVAEDTYYINHGINAGDSGPLSIAFENTTGKKLIISAPDISFAGADGVLFSIDTSSLPISVPTGETFQIGVSYDPTGNGVDVTQVDIQTGIASLPTLSVALRGLGHTGFYGSAEPPLASILDLYDIPVDVGFTTNNPSPSDFVNGLLGDEVELQLLRKAGAGPVTIEPLASYGPANEPDYRFGFYRPGTVLNENFLFNAETIPLTNGSDAQTVNVAIELGGTTQFDPGNEEFGLFGEYYPDFGPVKAYTQDELNTFGGNSRKYRFWPLKDSAGDVVPAAYVVGVEEATNDDFNDNVFIVRNVVSSNILLPGDYNADSVVDAADYTVYRDSLGQMVSLPNDITPGEVTPDDYSVWVSNYGATAPVSSSVANNPPLSTVTVIVSTPSIKTEEIISARESSSRQDFTEVLAEAPSAKLVDPYNFAFARMDKIDLNSGLSKVAFANLETSIPLIEDDLLLLLIEDNHLLGLHEETSFADQEGFESESFNQQDQESLTDELHPDLDIQNIRNSTRI